MTHMKKNILVVDDSALMRRVMCDIINSDSKFQATDYCRDGLEAYEKLKHTSYDGVVLDVNMPRMDGLQLLEKLQKEGIRANVVMVSTLTDSREADVTILAMGSRCHLRHEADILTLCSCTSRAGISSQV